MQKLTSTLEAEAELDDLGQRSSGAKEAQRSEPVSARIFRNGRNQAIRIPVDMSFETDTVLLEKRGDTLIVRPGHEPGWDRFFADPTLVLSDEFDVDDDPPPPDKDLF